MRALQSSEMVTLGLLTAVAAASFLLPDTLSVPTLAAAGATPTTVRIPGVVRDFRSSHPDFAVVPAEGVGHYAGNVGFDLGVDGRPVFNSGGDGNGPFDARIAHWKLDDGAGGTASDEMGLNPGTLVSGPTWTAGNDGGALQFDGVDDYVDVPSSPEMQITGDITFAGWFKLDEDFDAASPDTMVIMEKFLDTEHDFHIGLAGFDYNRPEVPKGSLVFKVENGPDSDHYRYVWTNRTSWTAGAWYHFAAVLVSSDTSRNKLFIDGVDDTDPVNAGGVGFIDTDYDAPMRFGGRTIDYNGMATDIYFKGAIDDVMIFDRALTPVDFTPTAGGYKVIAQWMDDAGNNIAPHIALGPADWQTVQGIAVAQTFRMENTARIDAAPGDRAVISSNSTTAGAISLFQSSIVDGDALAGPGADPATAISVNNSAVITGITAALGEPVEMPVPSEPTGLGPSTGDLAYSSDATIGAGLHVDNLTISNNAVVTVIADVTILCEGDFRIENPAQLQVQAGASLDLYVKGAVSLDNSAELNTLSADPALVTIRSPGTAGATLNNGARACANFITPSGPMYVGNMVRVWGNVIARSFLADNSGHVTVQGGFEATDACGNPITDASGAKGPDSTGGITDADTFGGWFRDVPGINLSGRHAITLKRDGAGVWSYLDDDFHPIDGRLLGNEGDTHNNHFTYHIKADFEYKQCWAQFLEFEGGDGVWVFVDGALVLDLGGVDAGEPQRVALDRLGLTDGQVYRLDLFYAEREASGSVFRLRTTLDLVPDAVTPTVSAMFD